MLLIDGLTYRLGERVLFDEASVRLPEGTRAGLVGHNGTGKTTLLNLISGELQPDAGEVGLQGKGRIGRLLQEAPDGPQSLIDYVLDADRERKALLEESDTATDPQRIADIQARLVDIDAHSAPARASIILGGLGFLGEAQHQPLSALSGGWRMRVALAALLFSEPELLLLDEPSNYLDLEGVMWLERFLTSYPRSLLIVSHDRDLLNGCVDTIVHLDHGKLRLYSGGYDAFERQRREKAILASKAAKKQEEQRKHLQAFVDRFKAKASKAKQAQSRVKMLARLEPISAVVEDRVPPFHMPDPTEHLSPPMIRVDDAIIGYGETAILKRLSLRVDQDDRIGLLGANGNGKSTFAKFLAGRLETMAGEMWQSNKLRVAFVAQHQIDDLEADETPLSHVRKIMPDASDAAVRGLAAKLGFGPQKVETPVLNLSGGEKTRLLIGLAAQSRPHLLILDEPTNHLDIDSREALAQALNGYDGAVMLISHDRRLLESCADRLWLVAEGTVTPYDGDLDDYRRWLLDGEATPKPVREEKAESKPKAKPRAFADQRERRDALARLRSRVREAEAEMVNMAKAMTLLDKRLAEPGLFSKDPVKAADYAKKRARAAQRNAEAEAAWLEASARLEEAEAA